MRGTPTSTDHRPRTTRSRSRALGIRAGTAAVGILALVACTSTPDPATPGTTTGLGGSDGSASTSSSVPSNSDENVPANPGSVSEQRPPMGES